jgi:hypothetical protein
MTGRTVNLFSAQVADFTCVAKLANPLFSACLWSEQIHRVTGRYSVEIFSHPVLGR